jgi:hypothetical protein
MKNIIINKETAEIRYYPNLYQPPHPPILGDFIKLRDTPRPPAPIISGHLFFNILLDNRTTPVIGGALIEEH